MGFRLVMSLVQELNERTRNNDLPKHKETILQKLVLQGKERILLEKMFYKHEWDIGSASVIRMLSEVGMFSLPIYLCKQSKEEQQNIFNDLLETEHFLLAELVRSALIDSTISQKLQSILSEGIAHLLTDLSTSGEIVVPNYLKELRSNYLNETEMRSFLNTHIQSLLELDRCSTIDEAIQDQFLWNEDNALLRNASLSMIASEICLEDERIFHALLAKIAQTDFTNWRFGLLLLNALLCAPDLRSALKKRLSDLFSKWISKRSQWHFKLLMLLGRQLSYSSGADKAETYRQWYKYQIADMNYRLKSKDEFQYAISVLTALVPLERDLELIHVHMTTAIPAPPYCKVFVTKFKDESQRRERDISTMTID